MWAVILCERLQKFTPEHKLQRVCVSVCVAVCVQLLMVLHTKKEFSPPVGRTRRITIYLHETPKPNLRAKRFRARPDAMPNATKNRAMTEEPRERRSERDRTIYSHIPHLEAWNLVNFNFARCDFGAWWCGKRCLEFLVGSFFSLFLFLACFDCLPREWSSTLQAMQIWSGGSGSSFSKCLLFPSTKSMRYVSTTSRRPIGLAL